MTILRKSLKAAGLMTIAALTASQASAQTFSVTGEASTTPSKYQFTMNKMELCESSACTSTEVLGETDAVFDIASVSANTTVGSYASGASLTRGKTFTHVKMTMGREFTMNGGATDAAISNGTNACFTDGTGTGTAGTTTVLASTTDADASGRSSTATDMVMFVPDTSVNANLSSDFAIAGITLVDSTTMEIIYQLTSAYTVTDSPPSFTASFDVSGTLQLQATAADACQMWFTPPVVTVTLQ